MKVLTKEEVEQAEQMRADYVTKATAAAVKVEAIQELEPQFILTQDPEQLPDSPSPELSMLHAELQDLKSQVQVAAQLTDVKGNWFLGIQEILAARKYEREHPRTEDPEPRSDSAPQA